MLQAMLEQLAIPVGAGKDTYNIDLPCQFIEIGDIADGTYTFSAIANAPSIIQQEKIKAFYLKKAIITIIALG